MGCTSSKDDEVAYYGKSGDSSKNAGKSARQENATSAAIDIELELARQKETRKVKLLILGAEESGKSTILKQMRMLHGSPLTEDDQKMYGVIVRSNIITAIKKLCQLLRSSGLEEQLASELRVDGNDTGLTPKEAYDIVVAHFVDCTLPTEDLEMPASAEKDWVGYSAQAKAGHNQDAKLFLKFYKEMKILWEVRIDYSRAQARLLVMMFKFWQFEMASLTWRQFSISHLMLYVVSFFAVKNDEGSVEYARVGQYN
jgi:G-protein alpha subunit